jgi:NDP-sugar pyrophosphorylase family protein
MIVLAAGASSRMKNSEPVEGLSQDLIDQANTVHKSLIRVGTMSRPFLDHVIDNAIDAGINSIAFVVNPHETSIQDYYKANPREGITIEFVEQIVPQGRLKPLGSADAIEQVIRKLPSWKSHSFLVLNADNLYSVKALKSLIESSYPNAMIAYEFYGLGLPEERLPRFAIIETKNSLLTKITEKPNEETLKHYLETHKFVGVSMNVFKLNGKDCIPVFEHMPLNQEHDEKILADGIETMVEEGVEFDVIELSEPMPDLTSKGDILLVQEYLKAL